MKVYQINERLPKALNASSKAPMDAFMIVQNTGAKEVKLTRPMCYSGIRQVFARMLWVLQMIKLFIVVPRNGVLFLQFPSLCLTSLLSCRTLSLMKKYKNVRIVTLIHDFPELRTGLPFAGLSQYTKQVFALSNCAIVHNQSMIDWIVGNGYLSRDMLVDLEIFDFLSEHSFEAGSFNNNGPRLKVVIAGNLNSGKSGFLKYLKSIDSIEWHLYGMDYDEKHVSGANIVYHGVKKPKELIKCLTGCFGLVWDGDAIVTCTGAFGVYLKYNNPHKMSLYLAAGCPIIIWSGAAQAEFVKKNKCGICVDKLADIPHILNAMNSDEICNIVKSADDLGCRIRSGYYLTKALCTAIDRLNVRA